MRETRNQVNRLSSISARQIKTKILLVFEGIKTEPKYFKAIKDNSYVLGIDPLLDVINIERGYCEGGCSHPSKVLEILTRNLSEYNNKCYSYYTGCQKVLEWLHYKNYIRSNDRNLLNDIICKCEEKFDTDRYSSIGNLEDLIAMILENITLHVDLKTQIEIIAESINNKIITYDDSIDRICMIVDRDKGSFNDLQYKNVLETCRRKKIELYVTNPCFELWLLFHYLRDDEDIDDFTPKGLIKNLKSHCDKFNKSTYNANIFMDKIDVAISNESRFCESIEELQYNYGSNIGKLIKEIIPKYQSA